MAGGFIAFALVIVGNWSAGRILLGALFFGLIDSLQLQLQAAGADVPTSCSWPCPT